ncbi:hypothetical protein [Vreelandella venusta]|uniref:hypothetical protein n=1 Tax=Vreelandella venusta TaxID=44935 RepID=UPI001170EAA8|nr:hypothetical protein [Halomonas venusta]GEK52368.1 hypothetical protein HVE01_30890 [Halomonas venusta]
MTITVIRSKQIPDTIELVSQSRELLPDQWGIRHRDSKAVYPASSKEEALSIYESVVDPDDLIDLFGWPEVA